MIRPDDERTVPAPERPSHWCRCPLCGGPAMVLATVHCGVEGCRLYDPGAVAEIEEHERTERWRRF